MSALSRRSFLAASALGAAALTSPARAAAPPVGKQPPAFYRYKVGSFELTAVYDGIWNRPVDETFVRNAPFGQVKKALADAFMPENTLSIPFTPLLVNTGDKLVLIDTASGGQISATAKSFGPNLAAAGIDPKAIDIILISNFHPDHINGIKTKDNEVVFPNAEIKVPAKEWAFWMDDANRKEAETKMVSSYMLNARRIFADIRSRITPFVPGGEVAPGITSIDAPGHTPGHTAYAVASGSESMMVLCDTTNHPALFVRHPEWQPSVDQDGPLAVATRRRLLDRVSADKMLVQGYHFPFPGTGRIVKTRTGYDFVPEMWRAG
jgi:glyoxylase-like metal-dependent hydrolase (beta-lactamase superfamily II)